MSHSAEKFRKGILVFLRKFLVLKIFMDEKGSISFSVENFWSQCRKILWASLQCFRKHGVSKSFMQNRGYQVFPAKIFGLTVPKNFVGIPSMFQKIWGIEKFYAYHVFPVKIFCLTVPKNFVGIPSMFQKIWGIEKFYA